MTSILLLVAWAVWISVLHDAPPSTERIRSLIGSWADPQQVVRCVVSGVRFGMVCGLFWLASCIRQLRWRTTSRLLIAVLGSYLYLKATNPNQPIGVPAMLRDGTTVGGILLAESIWLWVLTSPRWKHPFESAGNSTRPLAQQRFSIAQVMTLTFFAAVIMALAIRYRAPIAAWDYWRWLIASWVVLPLILVGVAATCLSRRWFRAAGNAVLVITLSIVGTAGLGIAETWVHPGTTSQAPLWTIYYGIVLTTAIACVASLSLTGRIDAMAVRRTQGAVEAGEHKSIR